MKASAVLATLALACGSAQAFPIITGPSPVHQAIIEYKNDITGHYVMLWNQAEIAFVEAGQAGPGWHRTGYAYSGFDVTASYAPPGNRMCRFYAPGPNSHFLTARTYECQGLRSNPASGWIFERDDIVVSMPGADGSCAAHETAVYRLYNNRAAFNDTNHRHVADSTLRADLISEGWIDEGVAFCSTEYATPFDRLAVATYEAVALFEATGPVTCPDFPVSKASGCLDFTGLAPMSTAIPRRIPPAFAQPNPQYPLQADAVSGWNVNGGCIHTALPAGAGDAIAQASFMQSLCTDGRELGVHIRGSDSSMGAASVGEVYRFPTALASDGTDSRLLPWADKAHSLTFTVDVTVKTVTNGAAGGKAQGEGIMRFHDAASGHEVSIDYRVYDTNPAPDSVQYDADTATTHIVTAFRDKPLVGELVHGNFIACSGPDCHQGLTPFVVLLTRDEFSAAIALAREKDPVLSPEPDGYMMAGFQMRNETTLDGELGVTIGQVKVVVGVLATGLPP